jgi:DNA-binding NtrC family response regulator
MGQVRGCLTMAVDRGVARQPKDPTGPESCRGQGGFWQGGHGGTAVEHLALGPASDALPGMIGSAPVIGRLARLVRRVAALPLPVLIRGESGSGKELVASALHRCGPRRSGPFVAINGAAVLDSLGSSVLFGHVRGAFTGASSRRQGAFCEANGGTLFLDEVAALSPQVQATLLRVVEDGQVQPMGEDRSVSVDVRLVAATCEPLAKLVDKGQFRGDLYQRLTGCVLRVPPLRDHLSDLRPLAEHLLGGLQMGAYRIHDDAISELSSYPFPGNVRELRNLLAQAALCCEGTSIRSADIAAILDDRQPNRRRRLQPAHALTLVRRAKGNVSAAARQAGMPRSTFRDLLRAAPS